MSTGTRNPPKLGTKKAAALMLRAIQDRLAHQYGYDPSVQNAIEAMASEFREGIPGLLAMLRSEASRPRDPAMSGSLIDSVLIQWARVDLSKATGHSRDWWAKAIG